VPRAWKRSEPIREDASAVAIVARPSSSTSGAVLIAQRIAWHPDTQLGRLGMDVGLLDTVSDHRGLDANERECFYELLRCASRASLSELAAATGQPDSVVPLFNEPKSQRGRVVLLEGVARRAVRIVIPDEKVRARTGLEHYWEVDIFTPDSQHNPVVLCVARLPAEFPAGEEIREGVRVAGFFLKSWAFSTGRGPTAEGRSKQLAPLIVAPEIAWLKPEREDRGESFSIAWAGALAAGLVVFALVVWHGQRQDAQFRKLRREKQRGEELIDAPEIPGEPDAEGRQRG
jgi:hypothetical protein